MSLAGRMKRGEKSSVHVQHVQSSPVRAVFLSHFFLFSSLLRRFLILFLHPPHPVDDE